MEGAGGENRKPMPSALHTGYIDGPEEGARSSVWQGEWAPGRGERRLSTSTSFTVISLPGRTRFCSGTQGVFGVGRAAPRQEQRVEM